jgi:hypothetical protein
MLWKQFISKIEKDKDVKHLYCFELFQRKPASVAARSKALVLAAWLMESWFESRSKHEFFFCVPVLCCRVLVEALQRADHSSKASYLMSLIHNVQKNVILNWNRP